MLERFGEGLARHFFFPYNEKLYRARPEELSLDWVGRYVPKPTLEEVVDGALGLHDQAVGYNAHFRYPLTGGIRMLPDAVAGRVAELRLGTEVVGLHLGERWIETADGGHESFDRLVSTISLPSLVDMVRSELPAEVAGARDALRWVRVLNIALGVEGAAPSPEHWLYFPDREIPFYRVGFPSNHGRLAPDGCHTVSVEVSLDPEGSEVAAEAGLAESALEEAGLIAPEPGSSSAADRGGPCLCGLRPPPPIGGGGAAPLPRRARRPAVGAVGPVEVLGDGGRDSGRFQRCSTAVRRVTG